MRLWRLSVGHLKEAELVSRRGGRAGEEGKKGGVGVPRGGGAVRHVPLMSFATSCQRNKKNREMFLNIRMMNFRYQFYRLLICLNIYHIKEVKYEKMFHSGSNYVSLIS